MSTLTRPLTARRSPGQGRRIRALFAMVVVGFAPVLAQAVLWFAWPRYAVQSGEALLWMIALSLVNVGAIGVGWTAWRILLLAAGDIERLMEHRADRVRLADWLARRYRRAPQLISAVVAAAASGFLLHLAEPHVAESVQIRFTSYLVVAWTAALGASALYWVVVIPLLAVILHGSANIATVWHLPASTPGIQKLSEGFTFAALAISVIAVVCEGLAMAVPHRGDSAVLQGLTIGFPAFVVATEVYIAVLPHVYLYLIIRRHKAEALAALDDGQQTATPTPEQLRAIELFHLINASPTLPLSTTGLVQFSAALVATLVAFVLGLVV